MAAGAVMILFQVPGHAPVLHTGDFRQGPSCTTCLVARYSILTQHARVHWQLAQVILDIFTVRHSHCERPPSRMNATQGNHMYQANQNSSF